jgi:hypothetical protein
MQTDLGSDFDLLNRNVDELIRLLQGATDAGIWTPQEAAQHVARLELVRAKLNADFRELLVLYERSSTSRHSPQNAVPLTKK